MISDMCSATLREQCIYVYAKKVKVRRVNLRLVACRGGLPIYIGISNTSRVSRRTFRFHLILFARPRIFSLFRFPLRSPCCASYISFVVISSSMLCTGYFAVNHVSTMALVFKVSACNCTRPFVGAQGTYARPRDTKYRGHPQSKRS